MESVIHDLRYAVRALVRAPGFTLAAIATLALGLGANTAIFGVIHGLFLRPLPFPQAERLAFVWGHRDKANFGELRVSLPVALDVAGRTSSFDAVGSWTSTPDTRFNLTSDGEPEDVQYAVVSSSLLPLLGATPARGRGFVTADDSLAAPRVVMISAALWQRRYGGGATGSVIGRAITLDGDPYTIVGVLPASFRFIDSPRPPDVWLPLGSDPFRDRRYAPVAAMGVVVRLAPGVSLAAARNDVASLARQIGREFPPLREWTLLVQPLRERLAGSRRQLLFLLAGAVALVLLIACTNVAGLLLARSASREREMRLRLAIGASPARLVRQLLTESVVLALLGGMVGSVLAMWGSDALAVLAAGRPSVFVPWRASAADVAISGPVFLYALAVSTLTGVLFGVLPALQATRAAPTATMQDLTRVTPRHAARSALVAAEVALSLLLLVGAGLLVRSFASLTSVDPGFVAGGGVAIDVALPALPYADASRVSRFYTDVTSRLAATPGITASGASERLPLNDVTPTTDVRIEGDRPPEPGREPRADYESVTPGWFTAAGIPLLRGRPFSASDDDAAPHVAIINEAMARALFGERDPVGQRVALSFEALRFTRRGAPPTLDFPSAYRAIVGVVGNVRERGLDVGTAPAMYVPLAQRATRQMTVLVRGTTGTDAATLEAAIRRAVHGVDPQQALTNVRTLEAVVTASTGESRFRSELAGALAAVALMLAVVGVFGVVAEAVGQRTREIGIRLALGAQVGDVVSLSARRGVLPVLIGILAGLPAAVLAAPAVRGLLFGVAPLDPSTFATVAILLVGAGVTASWMAARRAARIEPAEAMRAE